MFNKSTVLTAVVLVSWLLIPSSVAAATPPPACLLACLNDEGGSLNNLERLCRSGKIGRCLSSKCSDDLKSAQESFTNTCEAAGHSVSLKPPPTTASAISPSFATVAPSRPLVTDAASSTGPGSGSRSRSSGTVSATPSKTAGSGASLISIMDGALALVVLTAGLVL